jgi:uncharacterized membrane protein
MTREQFLAELKAGLKGLAPEVAADILADYEAHFAEGMAAGRSEADLAKALGDPDRLARELRAEAGVRAWEERRNPTAAVGAVMAVLGLATVDLLILLPLLIGVVAVLFGLAVAAVGFFVGGVAAIVVGLSGHLHGMAPVQAALVGFGLMAGAVGVGAILLLAVIGLVNLIVRYGRLHYRLLQPSND